MDIGGPFRTTTVEVSPPVHYLLDNGGSGSPRQNYTGFLAASQDIASILKTDFSKMTIDQANAWIEPRTPRLLTDLELAALGSTAISRVEPTNPLVDGASTVAELLREGLPSIPGTQRNPGSEYLNYQFGIAPTLGFAQDAIKAAKNADKVVKQLQRDSGKLVRRRYEFDEERETSTTSTSGVYPALASGGVPNIYVAQAGTLHRRTMTRKKVWFSGAFTYYFPESGWSSKLYEWDRLYGAVPGVDTLYNLVPWSWLVDYFTNVGDVLGNLNAFAFDGLVMPYGYVMCTQEVIEEQTWQGRLYVNRGGWQNVSITSEIRRTHKQRLPATPWGFGLTGDLTDRQLLILAALGISRV